MKTRFTWAVHLAELDAKRIAVTTNIQEAEQRLEMLKSPKTSSPPPPDAASEVRYLREKVAELQARLLPVQPTVPVCVELVPKGLGDPMCRVPSVKRTCRMEDGRPDLPCCGWCGCGCCGCCCSGWCGCCGFGHGVQQCVSVNVIGALIVQCVAEHLEHLEVQLLASPPPLSPRRRRTPRHRGHLEEREKWTKKGQKNTFRTAITAEGNLVDERFLHSPNPGTVDAQQRRDQPCPRIALRNLHVLLNSSHQRTCLCINLECSRTTWSAGPCRRMTTGTSTTSARRHPPLTLKKFQPPTHRHRLKKFWERWRMLQLHRTQVPPDVTVDLASSLCAGWSPLGRGSLSRRRRLRTVQSSRQPEGHPSSDQTRSPCRLLASSYLHHATLRRVAPRVESPTPRHTPSHKGRE